MIVEEYKSLKHYNTFGIDVTARYFVEVSSVSQLKLLLQTDTYQKNELLIIGGGSNLLLTGNFNGLVIKNSIEGIETVNESATEIQVKAGAGVVWHQLVLWSINRNLGGIENLSLIPGLAGAAPMQNIGAYGVEIKDVFVSLEAVDLTTGQLTTFTLPECGFGYRESVFKNKYKNKYFITSITLKLTKVDAPGVNYRYKTDYGDIKNTLSENMVFNLSVKAISDAVIKIRSSKLPDPAQLGNAGSFFKNPVITAQQFSDLVQQYPVMPSYPQPDGTVKVPAGWLIEQCGWKGKIVGNTGAHARQALVLVNYGNATGLEIWQLAQTIRQSVKEKFDIDIHPEVNVV